MPLLLLLVALACLLGLVLVPAGTVVLGMTAGLVWRYGLIAVALVAWLAGWGFLAQRGARSELVGVGAFGVPVAALLWWIFTLTRV
ncbi:hypothetical protein DM785_02695 [Deinococcus actinosclerus]|nr:hypothetical protein DM785_02695 [Deinococcus actinosclerus]